MDAYIHCHVTSDQFLHEEALNADVVLRRIDGMAKTNIPHRIVRHSPTGFDWGHGGTGPADLALNILLWLDLSPEKADRLHQDFKWKFVVSIPHQGGIIPRTDITNWLKVWAA